jgi:hypothetical protein
VLQTGAMTTFAKAAVIWCSIEESNHDCRTTKPEYYHYTKRAYLEDRIRIELIPFSQ